MERWLSKGGLVSAKLNEHCFVYICFIWLVLPAPTPQVTLMVTLTTELPSTLKACFSYPIIGSMQSLADLSCLYFCKMSSDVMTKCSLLCLSGQNTAFVYFLGSFGEGKLKSFFFLHFRKEPVKPEEGRDMANRINAFGYLECSAKTKDGVREVFEMATRAALQVKKNKKRKGCPLLWKGSIAEAVTVLSEVYLSLSTYPMGASWGSEREKRRAVSSVCVE